MSELADVLELLHTSSLRWRTLEAVGYEWADHARAREAFLRGVEPSSSRRVVGPGLVGVGQSITFGVDIDEAKGREDDEEPEAWRLWIEQPERRRVEFVAGGETVTAVWVGDTWWSWGTGQEIRTNNGQQNVSHGEGPSKSLVETAPLLGFLHLEVIGRGEMLGRSVFTVRGFPQSDPTTRHRLHVLGGGADGYILSVDTERGVILRSEAQLDDRPFKIVAMTEVAFDQSLPEDRFLVPEGNIRA